MENEMRNESLSGRRRSIPGIPITEVELDAKVRAIADQLFRRMNFCGHDLGDFDCLVTVAGHSLVNRTVTPDSTDSCNSEKAIKCKGEQ